MERHAHRANLGYRRRIDSPCGRHYRCRSRPREKLGASLFEVGDTCTSQRPGAPEKMEKESVG